ncbi:unnamed protein product [Acanthoscelides obtectus]|uniref:Uncharacterized protein n=1 Tax=Acanthoscelides obtectus TaxID=200917 RepID=A0A9P0M0U4_ACAOB|nr:unnamed protein product [Acanthoscelides obtectus]CAK1662755.1 hypothetical protein AOBTE_LOCUS23290 [Acanthoscelides obtectus]
MSKELLLRIGIPPFVCQNPKNKAVFNT